MKKPKKKTTRELIYGQLPQQCTSFFQNFVSKIDPYQISRSKHPLFSLPQNDQQKLHIKDQTILEVTNQLKSTAPLNVSLFELVDCSSTQNWKQSKAEWSQLCKQIKTGRWNLQSLALSCCSIEDKHITVLRPLLRQLTILNLRNNSLGDKGAEAIAKNCQQLIELNLTNNSVKQKGATAIAENLLKLEKLSLGNEGWRGNNEIKAKVAFAIAHNLRKIRSLDLESCAISRQSLLALTIKLGSLQELIVKQNILSGAFNIIQSVKGCKLKISFRIRPW